MRGQSHQVRGGRGHCGKSANSVEIAAEWEIKMYGNQKLIARRRTVDAGFIADGVEADRAVLWESGKPAGAGPKAGPDGDVTAGSGSASIADSRLLHSFFEEAAEIVRAVDQNARSWWRDRENEAYRQNLVEQLHTLKGGAQLCGLRELSEFVHRFEGFLMETRQSGLRLIGDVFRELLVRQIHLVRNLKRARESSGIGPIPPVVVEPGTRVAFGKLRHRLNAVVRQRGEALGKPVELLWVNAETVFDAGVLRRLVMPLEHVLRDAVHHGIELPERRRVLDKRATGRIELCVRVNGDEALIEVRDDGAGVDAARVRELAVTGGLLAGNGGLGDRDCAQFVFAPGLSTEERVWELCGRGLGLSAAWTGVARLGGRMRVSYRAGLGSTFVARVPREAEVERALTFTVRGDRYAVLDRALEEFIHIGPNEAEKLIHDRVFEHGGIAWEMHFPGEYLGYGRPRGHNDTDAIALLVRCGGRRIAFYGDAVEGRCDVLIRHAVRGRGGSAGVSLATLLHDGSLVVLLNPARLAGPGKKPMVPTT